MIKRNNLAAMNINFVRYPFTYFLDSVLSCGLEKVEVWGGAPHLMPDWLTKDSIHTIKKEIMKRNLSVICFTPEQCKYPISLAIQDYTMRLYSIDFFKKSIDIASELESPKVLVTAGYGYENQALEEAWKLCIDSLSILSKYAEKKGVELNLEVLSTRTSNILNTSKQASQMIKDIGLSNIYGMIDFCQMAEAFETPKEYYFNLGKDSIRHIHLIDGTPIGHNALGEGTLPIGEWCKSIESYGYEGNWSLEICDMKYLHNPSIAIEKSIKYLLNK
ncbi:MAG: TIM barrel protein [Pleomorphochaeta sp.]